MPNETPIRSSDHLDASARPFHIVIALFALLLGAALALSCAFMIFDTVSRGGMVFGSPLAFFGLGAVGGVFILIWGIRLIRHVRAGSSAGKAR